VISHNCEFAENVCPEKWRVYDFKCHVEGQDWTAPREKIEWVQPTTQIDAFGNETKVKAPKKKLSRQEQKQKETQKQKQKQDLLQKLQKLQKLRKLQKQRQNIMTRQFSWM